MRIVILLGALAIGLPFVTAALPNTNEPTMSARFFERGAPYSADTLRDFIRTSPNEAKRYAFPLLLPLDIIYALSAGLFLAIGSRWCAEAIPLLKPLAAWFMVLPALFILADVIEDLNLARMFLRDDAITDQAVRLTHIATWAKIRLMGLALAHAAILAAWALVEQQRGGP
jgi:hypothetical protein